MGILFILTLIGVHEMHVCAYLDLRFAFVASLGFCCDVAMTVWYSVMYKIDVSNTYCKLTGISDYFTKINN